MVYLEGNWYMSTIASFGSDYRVLSKIKLLYNKKFASMINGKYAICYKRESRIMKFDKIYIKWSNWL